MLWIIPRTNKIFLANETIYFVTVALEPSTLLKSISNKCKNLFGKSMYEFREFIANHGEIPLTSLTGGFHNISLRRARSEENILKGASSDPWSGRPDFFYAHRYFSPPTNRVANDVLPFSGHLSQIPITFSGTLLPSQAFLAYHTMETVQNKYYLRRTHSVINGPRKSLDEFSAIMKVMSKRYWQEIKGSEKSSKKSFDFTVMSYNVLAQNLLSEHLYLYKKHDYKALDWLVRWKNIFNEIKTLSPDVLCFQEVQESHLIGYYSQLESLGYRGLYKKRTGIRCDGCAIYYKPDILSLVEYETVEFYQPNVDILNRDNIAIIAKLCPKHCPKRHFVVATTHLLYNPRRQDVRLAQTQLLLTEVERVSFHRSSKGKEKYWPIVITGDFNSTPDSAVYELITKGILKYSHLAAKKMNRPETPRHGNVLVPCKLEITDACQHACLLEKRRKNEDISRTEEAALIKLHNSDKTVMKISSEIVNNPELFCSGTLSHLFALKSVYNHGTTENPEGTTFQDEWITVDYIFYSGKKQEDRIEDHKLKLVSVFRLPLKNDLGSIQIPNKLMGSDHLSLLAKFRMKL